MCKSTCCGGKRGMGWLPDYPDHRDFSMNQKIPSRRARLVGETKSIKDILGKMKISATKKVTLPAKCDISVFCSPVQDQGSLGSCTAQAAVSMLEYCERRGVGRYLDASRLFVYKVSRNLLRLEGDTGAYLRTAMGALALFGAPPEQYWPYEVPDFDEEPPAFCYSFAKEYQALQYFRLDDPSVANPDDLITRIKIFTRAGLPSMFGFSVFDSIWSTGGDGIIPFPGGGDPWIGGHAMLIVGYDNSIKVPISNNGSTTKGAFRILNSWGEDWGDGGFGWLAYDYLKYGLADDFWCLLSSEWIALNKFGLE